MARTGRAERSVRASRFRHGASVPPAMAAGMFIQASVPLGGDRRPVVSSWRRFRREKWTDFARVLRGAVEQLLVGDYLCR